MELKHIRGFIATFEEGSINRAAQRLGSPQPSLSVLIRDLEAEVGTLLFHRQARGAEPTEAARTIYPRFQQVLADVDSARMSVCGELNEVSGLLRIGLGPAVTRGLFPDALSGFLDEFPQVEVRITEGFSGRLTEWTLAGELDFAVIALPPKSGRLRGRRLSLEPILMISSRDSGRPHLQPIDLNSQTRLKIVLPWSKNSIRQLLEPFLQSGQIKCASLIEIDSIPAILDFVERGDFVTFLPLTAVARDLSGGNFVIQPVREPELACEFYLVYPARSTLSAASIAFMTRLEAAFKMTSARWQTLLATSGQEPAPALHAQN